MTFPARPELFLEITSPCSSIRSHSGGPQPPSLDLHKIHKTQKMQKMQKQQIKSECALATMLKSFLI